MTPWIVAGVLLVIAIASRVQVVRLRKRLVLMVLRGAGVELSGMGIRRRAAGHVRRGEVHVYLAALEDEGLVRSREVRAGCRVYQAVPALPAANDPPTSVGNFEQP